LDHLHANKVVRFIHQTVKHPEMPIDARAQFTEQLWTRLFKTLPSTPLLLPLSDSTQHSRPYIKLKTHGVSGALSSVTGKTTHPCAKTALRQVSDKDHKRPERDLARGGGVGRAGRQGRAVKTTGPKFKPGRGTPGRKFPIVDNNTVCESCDSHGHFSRDCPNRKPNALIRRSATQHGRRETLHKRASLNK